MLYELDGGPASDPEIEGELEVELEGSGLGSFRWSRRDEGKVRDVNCPLANNHRDLHRQRNLTQFEINQPRSPRREYQEHPCRDSITQT